MCTSHITIAHIIRVSLYRSLGQALVCCDGIASHLQVRKPVLQEADAPLHKTIGIECLFSCRRLQLLWGLHHTISVMPMLWLMSLKVCTAMVHKGGARLARLTLGKSTTLFTPYDLASATASSRPCLQPSLSTPGMEAMGMFCSPSWMKTGRMRCAGDIVVSEMAPLILGLRLFLLGLEGRSCKCEKDTAVSAQQDSSCL